MKPLPLLSAAAVLLAAAACLSPGAAAGETRYALSGPEVYRTDWNTRALVAHDLNGDGRLDIALLNNDKARVEILYQDGEKESAAGDPPADVRELEDGRFRRETVLTGGAAFALAAGDINGDGLADLAFTGDPEALALLVQGPAGEWTRQRVFGARDPSRWRTTIRIRDLDGDAREDLVVLVEKDLLVYRQAPEGRLDEPRRYPLSIEGCYGLTFADLDGDGVVDVSYVAPGIRHAWRIRFQGKDGALGPERAFPIEAPRGWLHPLSRGPVEGLAFAMVQSETRLIETLSLERASVEDPLSGLSPRIYSTPTRENGPGSFALGDLNGDGRDDVAVADRRGAQVWLFSGGIDGSYGQPVAYPSLSDLRSAAAGDSDGDGIEELFLASPREGVVGISRMTPGGRLGYPEPLPSDGKPLAVAAADLDGDGRDEIAYARVTDGVRSVAVLDLGRQGESWREIASVELAGLRTDPMAVEAMDVNQDGHLDLAVYTVQTPLRLLLGDSRGGFVDASSSPDFRSGLVANAVPAALSAGDLDGDGREEILAGAEGYARALRLTKETGLSVVDQFNASSANAKVAAALLLDLDRDDLPEVLLAETANETLRILKQDAGGVYRHRAEIPVGRIDLVETATVSEGERQGILMFGKDQFWWIPVESEDFRVRSLGIHESDLEDVGFGMLASGDLDGDGREELIAIDSIDSRVLQILEPRGEAGWKRTLHFTVFESAPHFQGRRGSGAEPREILIADLTADGRVDIALLVHDRVLVYPGI